MAVVDRLKAEVGWILEKKGASSLFAPNFTVFDALGGGF